MYCLRARFFIWKSPQEHLDCCTQLNVARRFCKSESLVPSQHCCRVGFDIIKLSFSKRASWPVGFEAIRIFKREPRVISWLPITITSSAKGCLTWIDKAQLSIMWRNHVNKVAEFWRDAQSIYLSQVGYRPLRGMYSGLERELFKNTMWGSVGSKTNC